MRSRKLILAAAIAATGLLSIVSSATASSALRTDPGGALLTGSTTLTNTSSTPFVYTVAGLGNLTCNQATFDADAAANTSATSISATVTAFTLTSCTDTIPVITFTGCHLRSTATPGMTITAGPDTGGTFRFNDLSFRCNVSGGTSGCDWTMGSATGTYTNATSALAFSNVAMTHVTGGTGDLGSLCGTSASASWTYTHVVQGGTNSTVTLTTS